MLEFVADYSEIDRYADDAGGKGSEIDLDKLGRVREIGEDLISFLDAEFPDGRGDPEGVLLELGKGNLFRPVDDAVLIG
jgi:hypothetical protein